MQHYSDLSPLAGIPLTALSVGFTKVSDLSPLIGMPLTVLDILHTAISDLSPLKGMELTILRCQKTQVSDLSPLKGMPLMGIVFHSTQVADLSPLSGMPLQSLYFEDTQVANLSPLRDMPLKVLRCDFKPFRDAELLRSIKTLETINDKPAAEFWKVVEEKQTEFEAWTKQVAGMSAEKQVGAVARKMQELNPGFDGKMTPIIQNGIVGSLEFFADNVTDISPVRALPELFHLTCHGVASSQDQLADLSKAKLTDLSALKGLPLRVLVCDGTAVSDLSPLTAMSLETLFCHQTLVSDLSPLKGMPLTVLDCRRSQVSDVSPLNGMPLTYLEIQFTEVSDLSPLKGMPLTVLRCHSTNVTDLSPVKDLPLKDLYCDFKPERDAEILHSIKTLETINGKPAAEFWKEVEEQQKEKTP